MIDYRLGICAAASIVGHFVLGELLGLLPERERDERPRKIEVAIVTPPEPPAPVPEPPKPEPEPPKPPEPEPVKPIEKPIVRPQAKPTTKPVEPTQPPAGGDPAQNPATAQGPAAPGAPTFSVNMDSGGGGGDGAPAGNGPAAPPKPGPSGGGGGDGGGSGGPGPGDPVPAASVTKLPLPQGRCSGKYTEAARANAVEGVVVLDLVVDAQGKTREISVVERLPHGLTEAAVAALRACRFSPGERDGVAVAVRVRGFKIRFVMDSE